MLNNSRDDSRAVLRLVETQDLPEAERRAIRGLLDEAFKGDFSDADWQHALGGWHALIGPPEAPIAHAALVERRILVDSRPFRTGYVEAMAVKPSHQGRGLGTAVLTRLTDLVRARYELGALSTGEPGFYERLGWERWRGPSYVRAAAGGRRRSAEEDEGIMVYRCARSQGLDGTAPIECEERPGDSW